VVTVELPTTTDTKAAHNNNVDDCDDSNAAVGMLGSAESRPSCRSAQRLHAANVCSE
jgi:hypothetical protein